MAPKNEGYSKKILNRGAWTAEEDQKLARYIETNGPRRWRAVAIKSGINRCGKSCRLRWLNYLRPNIKRGNITDAEEDLIVRLHKLLGNRWSLIAGRLPGRTDNEIKNYWNSHLSKKLNNQQQKKKMPVMAAAAHDNTSSPPRQEIASCDTAATEEAREEGGKATGNAGIDFDMNEFFDFSGELGSYGGLDWVNKFLELDEDSNLAQPS